MKKFVEIQSSKNIEVTEGLTGIDMTNPDAHVPDRLRVASTWVQTRVFIRQGKGVYPAFVQDWTSVQALASDGILTIGMETDEGDEEAEKTYDRVIRAKKQYAQRAAEAKADQIGIAKRARAAKAAAGSEEAAE